MTDTVRVLNDVGLNAFAQYLDNLRGGAKGPLPISILTDAATSTAAPFAAEIDRLPDGKDFENRYAFGSYLAKVLTAPTAAISRAYRLWSWLGLYYFDQICPPDSSGSRTPLANPAYLVSSHFNFVNYYRHLVRTPWMTVVLHGTISKVLLMPLRTTGTPLAQRGELIEQLASRQHLFSSREVAATAYALYFDEATGRPKPGTGGSKQGSPRRLAAVLQQLDLTYDLGSTDASSIVARLPKEFSKWIPTPKQG